MTRSDLTRSPDSRADSGASAAARRAKRRVLVVDDEKDLVDLISYNLTRGGFEDRERQSADQHHQLFDLHKRTGEIDVELRGEVQPGEGSVELFRRP